jgi:hypothetical protein
VEWSGTEEEWRRNGVEIRRLYLRGFRPPTTVTELDGKYIRRLYLPFTLRRSNLTAGAPGSTFFSGLNPDVREIVPSSQ